MPRARKEIPELEELIESGQKKFVRYKEGQKLYSMGKQTFRDLADEAGAVYQYKGCCLVNTQIVDEFLENFRRPKKVIR
ncbi:MAG: hypothetical protein IKP88_05285 [Lachnospiraceae bacterium]|jgi:hypothetical protein|nr:DUF6462 family protein [uncultured Butyrivibrio sp.]MBR4342098.1 hypothetical protein [Lachnospiraceae bacterium]